MAKRHSRKVSDATKFKMSIAKQGRKNPMFGKQHKKETKEKISKALTEYWRTLPLNL
ncbi:hypothetical protein B5F34_13925 [Mediterranea sp. An20]|mgnify:FL=1|nr:hypothetical protein B5F34_13925 [Mediterranea sp. An20]